MTHYRADRRDVVALGIALLSAATAATSGTFADALMATGWNPGAVVAFRITLAALLLTGPAVRTMRGQWHRLRAGLPAVLAFGLVAVAGCQLFFFSAVRHLPVGVALLLEYSGILLVVLWLWLRHGQRPGRLTVLGAVAAIAGLVLVIGRPTGGIDPVGIAWAALAAVGLAVYFVLSARVDDALPPIVLAWAGMTVGAAAVIVAAAVRAVPFRMQTRDVTLVHHSTSWILPVIGLGLISGAVAYAAGIAAARLLGARVASFVGLTEVLFAVLIAWALLGQTPSLAQLIGGVAVLVGIGLVRAAERTTVPAPSAVLVKLPGHGPVGRVAPVPSDAQR